MSRISRIVVLVALAAVAAAPLAPARADSGLTAEVVRTVRLPPGSAEIVAVSPNAKLAAVTQSGGKRVQFLKLPKGKIRKKSLDVSAIGEPTSVAFADDKTVFVAVKNDPNAGTLVVGSAKKGKILGTLPIGIGPDSIAVDYGRKLAVIAIEDEETEVDDPTACPPENIRPGAIQIVDFSAGLDTATMVVTTLSVDLSGVAGAGCADDPQPEFVAIDEARARAYVTLQENNALAIVDLAAKTIEQIVPLGTTTHLAYTNPDATPAVSDEMTGRREPDGVAVSPDGRYLFTADEGDTNRTADGVFSGGRTMSVWDAQTGEFVADTGGAIEQAVIDAGLVDAGRADVKGPEPEGVTVFQLGDRLVAAVGCERSRSVVFFDVTDPLHPAPCGIVQVGTRPEGIVYIPSLRLLLTANETTGDVTFVEIGTNRDVANGSRRRRGAQSRRLL